MDPIDWRVIVGHEFAGTNLTSNKLYTVDEAAEILNVSKEFVFRLLDVNKISFHHVGVQWHISGSELMSYKSAGELESMAAMKELAMLSQKMGIGYRK
jgi:excisionase family DNA binding protein